MPQSAETSGLFDANAPGGVSVRPPAVLRRCVGSFQPDSGERTANKRRAPGARKSTLIGTHATAALIVRPAQPALSPSGRPHRGKSTVASGPGSGLHITSARESAERSTSRTIARRRHRGPVGGCTVSRWDWYLHRLDPLVLQDVFAAGSLTTFEGTWPSTIAAVDSAAGPIAGHLGAMGPVLQLPMLTDLDGAEDGRMRRDRRCRRSNRAELWHRPAKPYQSRCFRRSFPRVTSLVS